MKRWKFWLPMSAVLGLLIWWTLQGLQGNLLILQSGQSLAADEIWVSGGRVFYKQGITIKAVNRRTVNRIVTGSVGDLDCYQPLLTKHLKNTLTALAHLKPPAIMASMTRHPLFLEVKPHLPLIAGGFLGLLLFLLGVSGWRAYRRKKSVAPQQQSAEVFVRLADFSDVETLFLNLYKQKLGAPASAPAEIEKTPRKDNLPGQVLNLKVHHDGKWQSRRMSLAPIGEGTGSKSQCFYVIFDTHMVIKIPPTPITDFEEYLTRVQAETQIMERLAPRVCVIPNLAVILSRIHAFPDADDIPPAQLEARYIRWLRKSPENQRYLTIGGSYVFFMDLARYFFLSHVAKSFHDRETGLDEEIRADVDILSDMSLFEGKYGRRGGDLWPPLHKSYESFREYLGRAIAGSHEAVTLSEWNMKALFLQLVAGRQANLANLHVPDGFRVQLQEVLVRAGQSGAKIRQRYQQLLNHYTKTRLFQRSRPLMGNVVTNLLGLLAWIDEKHISLRDLKPDNLLVAGNPDEYPHFLTSAKNFTIGLIDLETAVVFSPAGDRKPPQPQLGGTPLYCTPGHFFPNALLQKIYSDLPLVFHLQDWYAMIAIIFEVITGDQLFKNTAFQIPMMMKSVMQTAARKGNLKKKLLHFTRQFQDNAAVETREKFKLHAERLQAVSALVPQHVQQRLMKHVKNEGRRARRQFKQVLATQPAFNKAKIRQRLEKGSIEDLRRLRAGWAKRKGSEKLVHQISELIDLRQRIEVLARQGRDLAGPFPEVRLDNLLAMMFALVQAQLLTGLTLPAPDPALELPKAETASEKELLETANVLGYSATIHIKSD
jgi:serine/threonine protein kinase